MTPTRTSRSSRGTKPRRHGPGKQLTWRTPSADRVRELLIEAEDAEANHDPVRLTAAIEALRAMPGFPREMTPADTLLIEKIPPIISL
jgi:hypothetical protein